METNHLRPDLFAKVTAYSVTNHRSQFFERLALRDDGMTESGGNIASVNFILLDLEDYFTHAEN